MSVIGTSPNTRYIITGADTLAGVEAQKILFIGQKLSTGTAVSKQVTEKIVEGTEDGLFGSNSILSQMVKKARSFNKVNRFDAIALDDLAGGTNATATITFTGTATENKDLIIQIGNKTFNYSSTVTSGDVNTAIATALDGVINGLTANPYTSTVSTNVITVSYKHKGTAGNENQIKVIQKPAGVTILTSSFTGGAGAVDTANILDNVTERYQTIVYSQDLDELIVTDFLENRFNTNNDILDGVAFIGKTGSVATLTSNANAKNVKTLVYFGNADEMKYFELSTNIVSEIASKRALRLTDGADISDLVLKPIDARGGRSKASLPYFPTPLSLDLPVGRLSEITYTGLSNAGVSMLTVNEGNTVVLRDVFTTYKTNGTGTTDPSFKYLNYVDTMSTVREYFFNNTKNDFGQSRATTGELVVGVNMENETSIAATILSYYETMAKDGLLVEGSDAAQYFKDNLNVVLISATGTFTINAKLPIVTQARVFDGVLQLSFNSNGGN